MRHQASGSPTRPSSKCFTISASRTSASDFHKQRGRLGRKEFFADAFAAIASRQRPALVDMLGGNSRTALNVMLYFNRRYGI